MALFVLKRRAANRCLAISSIGLISAGCQPSEIAVYPVSGKVVVDGKPAADVQVVFYPTAQTEQTTRPNGYTDKDGNFSLTTRAKGDGAPAGEYKVVLSKLTQIGSTDNFVLKEGMPEKFTKPESTPLTAKVGATSSAEAQQLQPFDVSAK